MQFVPTVKASTKTCYLRCTKHIWFGIWNKNFLMPISSKLQRLQHFKDKKDTSSGPTAGSPLESFPHHNLTEILKADLKDNMEEASCIYVFQIYITILDPQTTSMLNRFCINCLCPQICFSLAGVRIFLIKLYFPPGKYRVHFWQPMVSYYFKTGTELNHPDYRNVALCKSYF